MIEAQTLPYKKDLFTSTLSKETLDFHYDKHHLGYVKKLNNLIASTKYENEPLETIIKESYKLQEKAIYNNAAQIWNHDFYWNSLVVKSDMPNSVSPLIKQDFKSLENFNNKVIEEGMLLFGSGWLWLVQDKNTRKLSLITTSNADNPLTLDLIPILTIDLWEHSYYVDYRNDRKAYLTKIVEYLNWNFANKNLIN
jgi:Fe-Mn family superoxide dismutase